jgi:flagellin-like hook-associated protein FlgL
MLPVTSLANTTFSLLQSYQVNDQFLADAAARIVSGKKLQHPSDNIVDYFRSERINMENSQNDYIQRGISEASSFSRVTETIGGSVLDQMQNLENLANNYWDPQNSADDKIAYSAAFTSAIDVLDKTIQGGIDTIDQTTGQNIYSDNGGTPFRTVTLDGTDPTQTLDISFNAGDLVDIAALRAINLGTTTQAAEVGAVQNEEAKAGSYVAKASANTISLQSQYNITQTKITQNSKFNDVLNGTDTVQQASSYTQALIVQQMTSAMLAQGNMAQYSVLALLKM